MNPLFLLAALSHAAGFDLGVGLRTNQPGTDAAPWGAQVAARVQLIDRLAVEGNVFGRFPLDPVSARDRNLVTIAHAGDANSAYRVPIDREVFAGELLVQGSPWARKRAEGVTVWGYAAAGVTLRVMQRNVLEVDSQRGADDADPAVLTPVGTNLRPGPVAGLGIDTWFGQRVGVRALARGRLAFSQSPDQGNADPSIATTRRETTVEGSVAISVDVLIAF